MQYIKRLNFKSFPRALLILSWWVLFLSWITPGFSTWPSFYKEAIAVSSLLLFAFYNLIYLPKIKINSTIIFLFLFSFIPLIQYKIKIINFLSDAILSFSYISILVIILLIGLNQPIKKLNFYCKWLAFNILFSCLLINIVLMYQWSQGQIRPSSLINQSNHLSTFLYFGIASVFYFYEKNLANAKILFFVLAFFVVGLAIVNSRTALVVNIVLVFYLIYQKNKLNFKISFKSIIFISLFNILSWFLIPILRKNFFSIEENIRITETLQDLRFTIWTKTFNALIEEKFWTGFGWNQITQVQQYSLIPFSNQFITSSHNLLLDLLLWNGAAVGLLISLTIIFYIIKKLQIKNSTENVFLFFLIIPFALHCLLEYPYRYSYFLIFIGFCLGLLESQQYFKFTFNINKNLLFFYLLIILTIFFQLLKDYINFIENHESKKISSRNFENIKFLDQMKYRIVYKDIAPQKNLTEKDLEIYRLIMLKYMTGKVVFSYAITLGINGKIDESSKMLALAQKLEDKNNLFMHQWKDWVQKYPELQQVSLPSP